MSEPVPGTPVPNESSIRIAIMTSGGDSQGMNAAVRGVTRAGP